VSLPPTTFLLSQKHLHPQILVCHHFLVPILEIQAFQLYLPHLIRVLVIYHRYLEPHLEPVIYPHFLGFLMLVEMIYRRFLRYLVMLNCHLYLAEMVDFLLFLPFRNNRLDIKFNEVLYCSNTMSHVLLIKL
jgi:hypothetical protein